MTDSRQLRLVVVGHVDHGKSTLIGRIFYDTGSLPEGKYEQLVGIAQRRGVPFEFANLMDGLVALNKDGKMVSIRVPYPLGFYAKGFDGRIDDPNAGWKGRGLWAANGDRTPWLIEGGKGTKPLAAHFQLRPDPLAH